MTISSDAPARFTARCPDDVLAVARLVLGFTPADSIVMLTFEGDRQFHARVDLPAGADPDAVDEAVEALLGPAAMHRVRKVVLLVYSEDADLADRVWDAFRAGCDADGVYVVDALRVTPTRWHAWFAPDPWEREMGTAYDISAHPFLVQSILEGRVLHASREELAATLAAVPALVARVEGALAFMRPWPRSIPTSTILDEGTWAQRLVVRHVSAGTAPSDPELARLLLGVQLLRVRDATWQLITRANAGDHLAFWSDVVRRCPERLVPPAACMLGWSAWQHGHGALAWCGIDRCEAVDPGYSLMRTLAHLLTEAVPPSMWEGCEPWDWRDGLPR